LSSKFGFSLVADLQSIIQIGGGIVGGASLGLADAWQAVLGDKIAVYRLVNAAKLQHKTHAELAKLGLQLNKANVPDRYAFTWFDEATKHDEDIQDIFAKLLAQAASGNPDALDRRHLEVVSKLTPNDAKAFDQLYSGLKWHFYPEIRPLLARWETRFLTGMIDHIVASERDKTVEYLVNVGLLSRQWEIDQRHIGAVMRLSFASGRKPDISNVNLKNLTSPTVMGLSLFLALHPEVLETQN
jgi:hypothetical protein